MVLYRSSDIRRYQLFSYVDWPGGLFGSPSMAGTRPGGNLAASWAAMMLLGQDGYMDVARLLMNVTQHMIQGIRDIPVSNLHIDNALIIVITGANNLWITKYDSICIHF